METFFFIAPYKFAATAFLSDIFIILNNLILAQLDKGYIFCFNKDNVELLVDCPNWL